MSAEAEFEAAVDRVVMSRLGTDRAYRNAASSEAASRREQELTDEVVRQMRGRWKCKRCGGPWGRGPLLLCTDCELDLADDD